MSFDYRVVFSGDRYAIHEVFYYEDGRVKGWTEDPVVPYGPSVEDLRFELAKYLEALNRPVLIVGSE